MGGYEPGSSNQIIHPFATLDCSQTQVLSQGVSDRIMDIKWHITFSNQIYGGQYQTYMFAQDLQGAHSDWVQVGNWDIIVDNDSPQTVSIDPPDGSSEPGQEQIFQTTYSDPNGWEDINLCFFMIATDPGIIGLYMVGSNQIFLLDDTGTAWLGGLAPGGDGGSIENSSTILNPRNSSVQTEGNQIRINWAITIKEAASGMLANTLLYVVDRQEASDGWNQIGTWTVNRAPSLGAIEPSEGSCRSDQPQNFQATFIDPDGWQRAKVCGMLFIDHTEEKHFALIYFQDINKLFLSEVGITSWLGNFDPGSAEIAENSVVILDGETSSIQGAEDTLSVNFSLNFKETSQNRYYQTLIYLLDDADVAVGWEQKGEWNLIFNRDPIFISGYPPDKAKFTQGDIIPVEIIAEDPDGDFLEYQFSVDREVRRPWSTDNTFNWDTSLDFGLKIGGVEIRDNQSGYIAGEGEIFIFRKPIEPE